MYKQNRKNILIQVEPQDDPFEDCQLITIPVDMNEELDETNDYLVVVIGGILVTLTILIIAYLAYTG